MRNFILYKLEFLIMRWKSLLAALFLLCFCVQTKAQSYFEPFVGWTFDESLEPQYWYGTSYQATYGYFPTAMLYANGNYGSSQFATVTTSNYAQMLKNDWVGTEIADPRPTPFDGYCLGFKHPNSAGRSFVLATPTSLYSNLKLRFAVTRSATGFKKMTFSWSLTGDRYSYQTIASKPVDALDFEEFEIDLSRISQLENQAMVFIAITIDSIGSTAYQGNIKFDNITLCGSKCEDVLEIHDSLFSGDSYTDYGFNLLNLTGDGDYLYTRRVHFDYTCDSVYKLFVHLTDTNTYVDPVDTTENPDDVRIPNFDGGHLVKVYPNPFSNVLHIEPAEDGQLFSRVVVFNSIGMKMEDTRGWKSGPLSGDICVTSDWAPGLYFVHVFWQDGSSLINEVIKWW